MPTEKRRVEFLEQGGFWFGIPQTLLDGLTRVAQEGLKIQLTPREKAQFEMARAAELVAKEAKFTI